MWYTYLLIVLLAILILWWLLTRQASFTETPMHGHHEHTGGHDEEEHGEPQEIHEAQMPGADTRAEPAAISPAVPDDLVIIEGIGPKIAGVLSAAGITTFSALAACDREKIRNILFSADPRLARISDPTSWPEQARLAASGDTVGLQKLQDSLKGGRQN